MARLMKHKEKVVKVTKVNTFVVVNTPHGQFVIDVYPDSCVMLLPNVPKPSTATDTCFHVYPRPA